MFIACRLPVAAVVSLMMIVILSCKGVINQDEKDKKNENEMEYFFCARMNRIDKSGMI